MDVYAGVVFAVCARAMDKAMRTRFGRVKVMADYSQYGEQGFILDFFAGRAPGSYVDIGASDGINSSNTRALFERGWQGLLIEPVAESFAALRDLYVNARGIQLIQAAVGEADGEAELFAALGADGRVGADNRHTMLAEIALRAETGAAAARFERRRTRVIGAGTLAAMLPPKVDLLSVDAEGMDEAIITSLLREGVRPELVIAEIDKGSPDSLDAALRAAGYRMVYQNAVNAAWRKDAGAEWIAAAADLAPVTEHNARMRLELAAEALPPRPTDLQGRGIIIAGGGVRYFPCAWVCIRMLRHLGWEGPIQLWHLGPQEMTPPMRRYLAPYGVECVDALEVAQEHPSRRLGGWELKAYAMLWSPFEEVLLLDADNVPVVNPAYLFDEPEYRERGAVFWPDPWRTGPERDIWRLSGVEYRDEPEVESGQVLVNKRRCWKPLALAMWMNQHSDFWYQHIYGDKDTFRFAWHKLGITYAMPKKEWQPLSGTMCQHDFQGRRLFQHRNGHKWTLTNNPHDVGVHAW